MWSGLLQAVATLAVFLLFVAFAAPALFERRLKRERDMLEDGDWEFGLRTSRELLDADPTSVEGLHWEVLARTGTGDEELLHATRKLVARLSEANVEEQSRWGWSVSTANAFITAGRYWEALAVESMWGDEYLAQSHAEPDDDFALLQVNLAEAEYNLGRWEEARRRLQPLEHLELPEIVAHGVTLQLAWIAAHRGDGNLARKLANRASEESMPEVYRTEVHYTRALAMLSLGRFEKAERLVRHGLKLAMRRSSERNGLYLLGRVLAAAGSVEEALGCFERGAEHDYKGQGGDGLLFWGDLLHRCGREEEARRAWALAIERDEQSESASIARGRLADPAVLASRA